MIFISGPRLILMGFYSIAIIVYLLIGYRVSKRGKSITNKYLAWFYFWGGISLSLNVIYAALETAAVTEVLANIVAASMGFAFVFLLIFILIVRHSQAEITKSKQLMWIAIAGGLAIFAVLVGLLWGGAWVEWNNVDWVPVQSWYYALTIFVIYAIFSCLIIYNGYKIRAGFKDADMRKRFTYFLISMVLIFFLMGLNPWANLQAISSFRSSYTYIAILILPAVILLYYSLGKEVSKKE